MFNILNVVVKKEMTQKSSWCFEYNQEIGVFLDLIAETFS